MASLLKTRKFGPFFWTQFLGAFNDNVYKNALVIMIAFKAATEAEAGFWVNLATGLFILPFLLLSPLAGQVSDKFDKATLIRIVKLTEIGIMALACLGFWLDNIAYLVAVLFLMGSQSTFFGPVKYSILPQHLRDNEIMTGTSLVETGTFVAILSGTILGGVLIKWGSPAVSAAIIIFSVLGWLSAKGIPEAPAADPNLKVNFNPFSEFKALYRISQQNRSVFLSVVGISWFWFYGATILAQIPTWVKHTLSSNEFLVTLFLSVFTLSIALGSWVSDKISDKNIELGIVPIGALGMSIFLFDLGLIDYGLFAGSTDTVVDFLWQRIDFVRARILLDLALTGFFGSFFIVPLYAILQKRSKRENCSRVIAANNIANSLFMVASAVMAMVLFGTGFEVPDLFLLVALQNLAVSWYIFLLLPEFVLRLGVWLLAKTVYTLKYSGREHVPSEGPLVIVANHISFIDWFVLSAACQRPVRFVMDQRIFNIPVLKLMFRLGKSIPIASGKEDPECKERAFSLVKEALNEGNVVCIFPEGMVSYDGNLAPFRPGIDRILEENQVPVIPVSIDGLWGSFFSRRKGKAMSGIPKPGRRTIDITIGPLRAGKDTGSRKLEQEIAGMLAGKQPVS